FQVVRGDASELLDERASLLRPLHLEECLDLQKTHAEEGGRRQPLSVHRIDRVDDLLKVASEVQVLERVEIRLEDVLTTGRLGANLLTGSRGEGFLPFDLLNHRLKLPSSPRKSLRTCQACARGLPANRPRH